MKTVSNLPPPFGKLRFHTASATRGHCNESVRARRSKPFAGSLEELPHGLVRIVSADDGENPFALVVLPRLD